MKPVEYAPTAWDSTRPRDLPPLDEKRLGTLQRAVRRDPLKGRGVQCREFLCGSDAGLTVSELKTESERYLAMIEEEGRVDPNLRETWHTLKNPVAILDVISKVAIVFGVVGGGLYLFL